MATSSTVRSITSGGAQGEHSHVELEDELSRQRFFSVLGPLAQYLDDPLVTNIHANADASIIVERFGAEKFVATETMDTQKRKNLLMTLANLEDGIIDRLQSSFSATMPYYGSRVRGFAPPIGGWDIVIRQHGPTIGPTNSGKTALVRALIRKAAEIRPLMRPVVIQKDRELLCAEFKDKLLLMARVPQARAGMNGEISHYTYEFTTAIEDSLQTNPGMVVYGELRDGASAVALLLALNTGTRGFLTTLHSDSPEYTLYRLEDLISFDRKPIIRRMIAKFVHVIVYMNYDDSNGRRWVSDIIEVTGVDRDAHGIETYTTRKVAV